MSLTGSTEVQILSNEMNGTHLLHVHHLSASEKTTIVITTWDSPSLPGDRSLRDNAHGNAGFVEPLFEN